MKQTWMLCLLAAAVAAALGWCVAAVQAAGNHLQYIVQPTASPADALADLTALAGEWETTQRAWTLGGFIQETVITAEGQSARGSVSLAGPGWLQFDPPELLLGRLFTPEELRTGMPLALVDEQLALSLFRGTDAIGRSFALGGTDYQVIGVVRHTQQVGDHSAYEAYVPLMSGPAPEALVVQSDPRPGVGAGVSFSGVCRMWQSGGAFIDLHREAVAATLWLRLLLSLLGAGMLLCYVRWLKRRVGQAVIWHQRMLQHRYALQLLPRTAGVALLLAAGYAAAALLAAYLLEYLLAPVYVFPEYVPAVLVEWDAVRTAFWQVQTAAADYIELRTPELLRLRFFGGIIRFGTACLAALLCRILPRKS